MALSAAAYPVEWSPLALRSFEAIAGYIEHKFGATATQKFVRRTMNIIDLIAESPELFRKSEKSRNKHLAIVTKQTTLYYKVNHSEKLVELLLFWDTRQDPANLKY
jgi:plasmid stabilization system protein ParE